jgi:hypothetical protein
MTGDYHGRDEAISRHEGSIISTSLRRKLPGSIIKTPVARHCKHLLFAPLYTSKYNPGP